MGLSVESTESLFSPLFLHPELEFGNVGFCGGRKTGVPGEKPSEHTTPRTGIEPGPHWWEASALTTASSVLTL